jgi:hypothetical protein
VLSPVPAVQPAFDAPDRYPKLAPFTSVRWRGDVPEVQIANKTWYELVAVNAVPVAQVIDMQRGRDPQWRKHFAEDLVETFGRMNHALARTVDLQVRTLDANKTLLTLSGVPMTAANRDAVMMDEPINPKALFLFLRWVGDMPQVKIRVTWYELLGVEDLTTAKLIDQAKAAYGDQWQDQFQACLVNDLVKENLGPLMTATAKLRTLDTDQQVTIDMLMPLQPAR